MRFFLIAALVLIASLSLGEAAKKAPTSFVSESELSSLASKVSAQQKKDGSFLGLKNTYYAVASLRLLKTPVPNKKEACDFLHAAPIVDAESAYYSIMSSDLLGCFKAPSDQVFALLKAGVASSSLHAIHYSFASLIILKENNSHQVPDPLLFDAVSRLIDFAEDDGTFKASSDDEYGSKANAGLATQTLALAASRLQLRKEITEQLNVVLANVVSIQGESSRDGPFFYKDEDEKSASLQTNANLFKGISILASVLVKKITKITEDNIVGLTQFFLSHKGVATLDGIFYFMTGIDILATNKIAKPLVVSFAKNSLSLSSKEVVQVAITDLYGKFATAAKVVVLKAVSQDSDKKVLLSNQELPVSKTQNHIYEANFLASKPEPKSYYFEVSVIPASKDFASVTSALIYLKVTSSVSVEDFVLSIADSKEEGDVAEGNSLSVTYPKSVKETKSASQSQYLVATFRILSSSGKGFNPQQVFLGLINSKTQEEVVAVASSKGSHYTARISLNEAASQLKFRSGEYEVKLIVGDAYIENPMDWSLAKLSITFDPREISDSPFASKPEIKHVFRSAEKRPTEALSLGFTGAVLFPLVILLVGLLRVGVNFSNVPSGAGFLYAVAFQGGLAAILFLYTLYWFRLTMVETLVYLGFLGAPTAFFGMKTLNYLSEKKKTD